MIANEDAGCGLDIQVLEHVLNFDLPSLAEDFVHRIGRTGRAGSKGQAISSVSREEERSLNNIEKLIGERIKRIKMPGYAMGSRESLLNTVKQRNCPARTNKASQTKIGSKSGTSKAGKKKKR